MISLVTNASYADANRIRHVIPHWLRVFGNRIVELVIVLDTIPASGRIQTLHQASGDPTAVRKALEVVVSLDRRIRVIDLPPVEELRYVTKKWFVRGHPVRCQAGTPILAFLYAMEQGRSEVILRADCDILFRESSWLAEAERLARSGEVDLVEPPRLGRKPGQDRVTTRALVFSPSSLSTRQRIPIVAHRLDLARRLHRAWAGRPTWLALEQTFQAEVDANRLTYRILEGGGYWLHVCTRAEMEDAVSRNVIDRVERDDLPRFQRTEANYRAEHWIREACE